MKDLSYNAVLPFKKLTKRGLCTLEEQLSIIFMGIGFFLSFSASVANALLDFPLWINLPHIINAVVCLLMALFLKKWIVTAALIELFFATFIYFPFIYFTNAGYMGSGLFYFLMVVFWIAYYLDKKTLNFMLVFSLFYYTCLIVFSYKNPEYVIPYPDPVTNVIDVLVAIFAVSISLSAVTGVTFRAYKNEHDKVQDLIFDLNKRNEELKQLSITDQLTGVFNRRHFINKFNHMLELFEETPQSICVFLLDIDHFKHINDQYGHQYGDEILKRVAEVIQETLRPHDLTARYGGEEFITLVTGVNEKDAIEISERIRTGIENMEYRQQKITTVSIGISYSTVNKEMDLMVKEADSNLYQAKNNGRNQVCHGIG